MNLGFRLSPSFFAPTFVRRINVSAIVAVGKPPRKDLSDELYADINRRVSKYRLELRRHVNASLKHRQLKYQMNNLTEALSTMEAKKNAQTTAEVVPSRISLEVLSSGTNGIEPSVLIRTPTRGYLINCPEGTSRILPNMNLRANNINDVLITSCNIRRIGGISGFMLTQCHGVAPTRIHGPPVISNYLEFLRPFADAEFGEVKYPGKAIDQSYSNGRYTDITFTIDPIPMHDFGAKKSVGMNELSVAFVMQTTPAVKKIDMAKVMQHKVPKGPLIGKLKGGESVTLPDGRVVTPADVYADCEDEGMRDSAVLFVDALAVSQVPSLLSATTLQPFTEGAKQLDYVVHFTNQQVYESTEYQQFCEKVSGSQTSHLVVNGSGNADPHLESVYRLQAAHSLIDDELFPKLQPQFEDIIKEDSELVKNAFGHFLGRPMQRFVLRGPQKTSIEPCMIDLRAEMNPAIQQIQKHNLATQFAVHKKPTESEAFPKIIFLGTSSAVPSKYRNVTSVLVQTAESFYMIDCGEGTFGQLKQMFGDRLDDVLRKLNVVFLTHTHQDHTNGLVTLLQERQRAFLSATKENESRQLVVVCNRNILKHMHTFSQRFYDVLAFARFLVPNIYVERKVVPANLSETFEQSKVAGNIPDIDVMAVKVNHTSDAVGYIFTTKDKKRKLVFSGDTTPCDMLIEYGKGAHVLVHEATFEDGFEKDAAHKKHSTMRQAVDVGRAMGAKHIILTHFSARYPKVPALPDYLDEFGVSVAMDNLVVSMDSLARLPKLNDVYRSIYDEELFDIEKKASQRGLRVQAGPPPTKKRAIAVE